LFHFQLFPERKASEHQICAAAVAAVLGDQRRTVLPVNRSDPFNRESGVRFNHFLSKTVELTLGDVKVNPKVVVCGDGNYIVTIGKKSFNITAKMSQVRFIKKTGFTLKL
jgi:hypothetical protein